MSSSRRRSEETGGQNQQKSNFFLGLDPGTSELGSTLDTQSTLSLEDFYQDVNQSVASSNGLEYPAPYVVSPPTSIYSHSNAGDFCDPSQFPTSHNQGLWGCDFALSESAPSISGCDQPSIDPQLLFSTGGFVQQPYLNVPLTENPPEANQNFDNNFQPNPTEATLLAGSDLVLEDAAPASTPEIRVEDFGLWLQATYHAGDHMSRSQLVPPQVAPLSTRDSPLNLSPFSRPDLDDDERSDSSFNTSHTGHSGTSGHSCSKCRRQFNKKDDLRRHSRYHESIKKHICDCGKSFVHPKDLRRHRKTHETTKSAFHCPVENCAAEIGRADNLKRHVLKQHPGYDMDALHSGN